MPNAPKQFIGRQRSRPRSRQDRGYDDAWLCIAARHNEWFPLCAKCERAGLVVVAEHADHVVPFKGMHDKRRLDPMNVQSLCATCNSAKKGNTVDYRTDAERARQAALLGIEPG